VNADDHQRARALASDLQTVQQMLQRWAAENQHLADENEELRKMAEERKPLPEPKPGDPPYLSPKQLAARWGMHHGSILRKLRQRELPTLIINSRSIRIPMADVLAYEAQNILGKRRWQK
jgi:hypothetical protein